MLLTDHARELAKACPEWEAFEWENYFDDGYKTVKITRVTGAVAPIKTRGPNKGQRNWRERDKSTERTVYITPAEHAAWLAAWEQRTGKCSKCEGSGQVFKSWNVADGVKTRTCEKCCGSGIASADPQSSPAASPQHVAQPAQASLL